jgi:hypothetical protein
MPYPWAIIDKWTSSLVSKIGEEIEHSKKTRPTEIGQATHAKYSRRTGVSADRTVFTNAPQGGSVETARGLQQQYHYPRNTENSRARNPL